jgi:hypothetical protein
MDAQDVTCHNCYMKLSGGGVPKGYEGCTTIGEVASRKKSLESQPLQALTTRGLTGQSWNPPKTSAYASRSFSTFRATWTTSNEREDLKESPIQDSLCHASSTEADLLEAKRQYQLAKNAYMEAQSADPQIREGRAAAKHEAELRVRRAKYAWRMATDLEWKTEYLSRMRNDNNKLARRKANRLFHQRSEVRTKKTADLRSARANDPVVRLIGLVYEWVRMYPMVRTMAGWTSFKPVSYSEKIAHHCQGCGFKRSRGLKLWWQQSSGADLYQCHTCFTRDGNGGLPEAYKDCTTLTELNTRFEQLNGVRPKRV